MHEDLLLRMSLWCRTLTVVSIVLTLIGVVGFSRTATAGAETRVRVTLASDPGQAPTTVCVLTSAGATGARLADGMQTNDVHFQKVGSAYEVEVGSGDSENRWANGGDESSSCRPRFAANEAELYVTCAHNSLESPQQGADARVLILGLGLDSETSSTINSSIEGMTLTGSTLEFHTTLRADKQSVVLHARGGYYETDSRLDLLAAKQRPEPLALSLTPHCGWMRLQRPPMLGNGNIKVKLVVAAEPAEGKSLPPPVELGAQQQQYLVRGVPSSESFDVWVPRVVDGKNKNIVVLDAGEDRFSATWSGPTPEQLVLSVEYFGFSWVRDSCYWAYEDACPSARIQESGVTCKILDHRDASDTTCHYRCPGDGESLAGLRVGDFHIVMTGAAPNEQLDWNLRLTALDQQFVGYVSADERRVGYLVEARQHDFDVIERIEFGYLGESGMVGGLRADYQPVNCEPRPPSARFPGVGCTGQIHYRYVGDRSYRAEIANLSRGKVELASPVELGREFYAVGQLGGGALFPRASSADVPGAPLLYYVFEAEVGMAHWPLRRSPHKRDIAKPSRARGWRFEYRVGGMISPIGYQPIDPSDPENASSNVRTVSYVRFAPALAFYAPWIWRRGGFGGVSWGSGFGPTLGRPLFQRDVRLFDAATKSYDVGLRLFLEARLRLSQRVRSEVYFRYSLILIEDNISFTTDGRGDAQRQLGERRAVRQLLTLGLNFSI